MIYLQDIEILTKSLSVSRFQVWVSYYSYIPPPSTFSLPYSRYGYVVGPHAAV